MTPLPSAPATVVGSHLDFRLGFDPMDTTHQEFLGLLDALRTASGAEVPAALAALHAHTREHFAAEDRWMQETAFPARECHQAEHAAVLASMGGVERRVAAGDAPAAAALVQALSDWFPGHADHLDSALAHWMCKRTLGGKPVVLRRLQTMPATART